MHEHTMDADFLDLQADDMNSFWEMLQITKKLQKKCIHNLHYLELLSKRHYSRIEQKRTTCSVVLPTILPHYLLPSVEKQSLRVSSILQKKRCIYVKRSPHRVSKKQI